MSAPTDSQRRAIAASGNVLVVAGAGTGKTRTLVERCLVKLAAGCSLENILMVTFTDAAAAEMRKRIREGLETAARTVEPAERAWLDQQLALLDTAHICTLSSFCLHLVQEHFYELEIDPQISVLDEQQTHPLIQQTLEALLQRYYGGDSPQARAVQALVRQQAAGADEKIRALVVKLHRYTQALPSPDRWFEDQFARFHEPAPALWRSWLADGFNGWRALWLPRLRMTAGASENVAACLKALRDLPPQPAAKEIATALQRINLANADWPHGTAGKFRDPLGEFFNDAKFLGALCRAEAGRDPLAEDWDWVRPHVIALLQLAREFSAEFTRAKRDLGGVDFADIEQLALRLLRDPVTGGPAPAALGWRRQFHHIFVDEYQDINEAQDKIIEAISRGGAEANRFLVGDVKQSIYRFRLANPRIFRDYEEAWRADPAAGQRIPLRDNFRSREAILYFINPLFSALMRRNVGGVAYDADAQLQFGLPAERKALSVNGGEPGPPTQKGTACVEFHLLTRSADEPDTNGAGEAEAAPESVDLDATEKEARLVAVRLLELKQAGHRIWDDDAKQLRPVTWSDMVVLLRSPRSKVEAFAREFSRVGVPLQAARGGFFDALEIMDLLNLLKLLDNPLQDVPLLAVLHSPLVGLTLEELAEIRAHSRERLFWTTLQRFHREVRKADGAAASAWRKVDLFLGQFAGWRQLIRQTSLSFCLETVLAETHFETLLMAEARGPELAANVRRLLNLARQYDPYQRQGLFRFLRFVEAQQAAEVDQEPAPAPADNVVRLLSIHKSKGLEFPVVVVAGLGGQFNLQDLREDILLDDFYGLCPKVAPPGADQRYPSLPYWLARRRQKQEALGEELRLLYVALTRARDKLILTGRSNRHGQSGKWESTGPAPLSDQEVLSARSCLDWLRLWLPQVTAESDWRSETEGESNWLRWTIYADNDARLRPPARPNLPPASAPEAVEELDAGALDALRRRIEWRYEFNPATAARAKRSVSELRRQMVDEDEEAEPLFQFLAPGPRFKARAEGMVKRGKLSPADRGTAHQDGAARPSLPGELSAADRGTAHHTFLQHVAFDRLDSLTGLEKEAERLLRAGNLAQNEADALDLPALAAFWNSDLGKRIRAEDESRIHRELAFTLRLSAEDLARLDLADAAALKDEFIVAQGRIDVAVIRPKEIWLLDFKTDQLTGTDLEEKSKAYAPQLELYALALSRIYQPRPVTERWLHFLAPGKSVRVEAWEAKK